jgi:ATP adenylyltransferase
VLGPRRLILSARAIAMPSFERLWSPWRLQYVSGAGEAAGCVFCDAQVSADAAELVLYRASACFVILNLFPYTSGHLMVVPNRHVAALASLSSEERSEMIELTRLAEQALTESYQPQGLNVGMNLGRAAGAGIVDHLHIHVVPRWNGDTNFISVVGQVRVLPEDLAHSAARLRPVFERLAQIRSL